MLDVKASRLKIVYNRSYQVHSVSEHLQYCIDKYCPGESLDKARNFYFEHVNHEMKEIMEGRGRKKFFCSTGGIKRIFTRNKSKRN